MRQPNPVPGDDLTDEVGVRTNALEDVELLVRKRAERSTGSRARTAQCK